MKCFEIWMAELPDMGKDSHIQQGIRPVVIVSNDAANTYSPVVTVVPLTTRRHKKRLPTHAKLKGYGLVGTNLLLAEQIITIDRDALFRQVGTIDKEKDKEAIRHCLAVQLNMVKGKEGNGDVDPN